MGIGRSSQIDHSSLKSANHSQNKLFPCLIVQCHFNDFIPWDLLSPWQAALLFKSPPHLGLASPNSIFPWSSRGSLAFTLHMAKPSAFLPDSWGMTTDLLSPWGPSHAGSAPGPSWGKDPVVCGGNAPLPQAAACDHVVLRKTPSENLLWCVNCQWYSLSLGIMEYIWPPVSSNELEHCN